MSVTLLRPLYTVSVQGGGSENHVHFVDAYRDLLVLASTAMHYGCCFSQPASVDEARKSSLIELEHKGKTYTLDWSGVNALYWVLSEKDILDNDRDVLREFVASAQVNQ